MKLSHLFFWASHSRRLKAVTNIFSSENCYWAHLLLNIVNFLNRCESVHNLWMNLLMFLELIDFQVQKTSANPSWEKQLQKWPILIVRLFSVYRLWKVTSWFLKGPLLWMEKSWFFTSHDNWRKKII